MIKLILVLLNKFLDNYFKDFNIKKTEKLTSDTVYFDYRKYKECNTEISQFLFRKYTKNLFIRKGTNRNIIGFCKEGNELYKQNKLEEKIE